MQVSEELGWTGAYGVLVAEARYVSPHSPPLLPAPSAPPQGLGCVVLRGDRHPFAVPLLLSQQPETVIRRGWARHQAGSSLAGKKEGSGDNWHWAIIPLLGDHGLIHGL